MKRLGRQDRSAGGVQPSRVALPWSRQRGQHARRQRRGDEDLRLIQCSPHAARSGGKGTGERNRETCHPLTKPRPAPVAHSGGRPQVPHLVIGKVLWIEVPVEMSRPIRRIGPQSGGHSRKRVRSPVHPERRVDDRVLDCNLRVAPRHADRSLTPEQRVLAYQGRSPSADNARACHRCAASAQRRARREISKADGRTRPADPTGTPGRARCPDS